MNKQSLYPAEMVGLLTSIAAVGMMMFFCIDIEDNVLAIQNEVPRFVEHKNTVLLLLIISGMAFGSLVSAASSYYLNKKNNVITSIKDAPRLTLLLAVSDVALIAVSVIYLAVSSLGVTLIVWLLLMVITLVVPVWLRTIRAPKS